MVKIDSKKIVTEFLKYMIESDAITEEVLIKYLHPDFIQHVDGKTLNRDDCIAHAKSVKSSVRSGKVTFEHVICEQNKVCTVHIPEGVTKEGNTVKFKVIAYFELKDNKISLFDELTMMIEGGVSDRDITSRH